MCQVQLKWYKTMMYRSRGSELCEEKHKGKGELERHRWSSAEKVPEYLVTRPTTHPSCCVRHAQGLTLAHYLPPGA